MFSCRNVHGELHAAAGTYEQEPPHDVETTTQAGDRHPTKKQAVNGNAKKPQNNGHVIQAVLARLR